MLTPRYVDTREAPERKVPLERAGFALKALRIGDVTFPEAGGASVVIECKKVDQLLTDMMSGQLVKQCRALAEASSFPWLLIEGELYVVDNKLLGRYSISKWQMRRQLRTLQDLGVRWERSNSAQDTVETILDMADYYAKGTHESALRHVAGDEGLAVLSHIYGVGKVKAEALVTQFGSLRAIAAASRSDFESTDGIGPQLSERLESFFSKDRRKITAAVVTVAGGLQ